MILAGLKKAGLVALGYIVAVFVAVTVSEALMLAPTALPDGGRFGSIFASLRSLPEMFGIGLLYTFVFALPGFLVFIALARGRNWRTWLVFSLGGAVNALFSLTLFATYTGGGLFDMSGMAIYCSPGGFAGGAAYWALAIWRLRAAHA